MINKERLKELIKEKATIWYSESIPILNGLSHEGITSKIELLNAEIINEHLSLKIPVDNGTVIIEMSLGRLYESEDDIEEYLKYGNIIREEKLTLPFWYELKNKSFIYETFRVLGQSNKDCVIYYTRDNKDSNLKVTICDGDEYQETIFNKPLTRENYNEARDLCLKLFMGEEE